MRSTIIARLGSGFEITGRPPVGQTGSAYSYTFGTVGGSGGTVAWTHTSLGSSGAGFNDATGELSSATLLNGGSFPFTLTATDPVTRQVATASFVLVVLGASIYRMVRQNGDPMLTQSGSIMSPQ